MLALSFAACGGSHGPAPPPTPVAVATPLPDAGIPSDGTGEPDALLLAEPPHGAGELGIAVRPEGDVSYWNLWSDCAGCEVVVDEIRIKADGKREELLHSSAVAAGRLAPLVTLDAHGFHTLAVSDPDQGLRYTIYFNARLCAKHDVQTCRPARAPVVAWDHQAARTATYADLAAFEKAANLQTGCSVTDAITTCKL